MKMYIIYHFDRFILGQYFNIVIMSLYKLEIVFKMHLIFNNFAFISHRVLEKVTELG